MLYGQRVLTWFNQGDFRIEGLVAEVRLSVLSVC